MQKWYDVFPNNPYARVLGLVPIGFFVTALVSGSLVYFANGYRYVPQVAEHFSSDLSLLNENLSDGTVVLLPASSPNYEFYKLVESKSDKNLQVSSTVPKPVDGRLIVSHDYDRKQLAAEPSRIVTSAKANNADRWYIYD
jgi:hypothetical protein